MELKFIKDYRFAHGGTDIKRYEAGQIVETSDDRFIKVAVSDGAAVDTAQPEEPKKPTSKKK